MTLREELGIWRGRPIDVTSIVPEDIPCIETSDAEKLCTHPFVSVHMITYNHESYIRQAIEGVMMQQTDFEFELVIGEDCSQDKTREICFEYQKRYPDKIRVLWWHENVSQLGGNGGRVTARCRGEFIAFCEGDDYWTDPLKLQKQVDVMRQHPEVGLCFAKAQCLWQKDGRIETLAYGFKGIVHGQSFLLALALGMPMEETKTLLSTEMIRTPTAMIRVSSLQPARRSHADVFSWKLLIGDTTLWGAIATCADIYFLDDEVAAYRIHAGGLTSCRQQEVRFDGLVVRAYLIASYFRLDVATVVDLMAQGFYLAWVDRLYKEGSVEQRAEWRKYVQIHPQILGLMKWKRFVPYRFALLFNGRSGILWRVSGTVYYRLISPFLQKRYKALMSRVG